MALSRQDFGMIIDAIDSKIASIENSKMSVETLVTELGLWQKFKLKILRMWNEAEARMTEIEKERGQ